MPVNFSICKLPTDVGLIFRIIPTNLISLVCGLTDPLSPRPSGPFRRLDGNRIPFSFQFSQSNQLDE